MQTGDEWAYPLYFTYRSGMKPQAAADSLNRRGGDDAITKTLGKIVMIRGASQAAPQDARQQSEPTEEQDQGVQNIHSVL